MQSRSRQGLQARLRHPAYSNVPPAWLRDYAEGDLPSLHALDQSCFPPGIAYTRAELSSFLHHPSAFTTVACLDGGIMGFAIVRPIRRLPRQPPGVRNIKPVLHLLTIDVATQARRQGVGALLMQWVFEQAAKLETAAVVLEVAVDNRVAQCFYQRFGFVEVATIPGYYNGVTDALEMERPLALS